MRVTSFLTAFCAFLSISLVQCETDFTAETTISIQVVGASTSSVQTLAQIQYNPTTLEAAISSYEPPTLETEDAIVKLGVYNSKLEAWERTTAASAANFAKGYVPVITLVLHTDGSVAGVSCKSERIDAGHTRDFGPKVVVTSMQRGNGPELNGPIALSPEGKVETPVKEKTLLQKYWMVGLGILVVMMIGGGGDK